MLGEALREYLAPEGVSVSLVYPGYIQTAQTACYIGALPLQMLPDRAAAIIRSRVDRGRSFIAFPLRAALIRQSIKCPNRLALGRGLRFRIEKPPHFVLARQRHDIDSA